MPETDPNNAISEKEQMLIEQLRSNVSDLDLTEEYLSDDSLVRWLRARELVLPKAESMLRESIRWRCENKMDLIEEWEAPELLRERYRYQITGVESGGGCTIVFCPLGEWHVKEVVEQEGSKAGTVKYTFQAFERALALHPKRSLIVVLDMGPLTYGKLASISAIDAILTINRDFERNYPEVLKAVLVIRAPRAFSYIFKMVQPILSKRTLGKVEIFSTGDAEQKWKSRMGALIPQNLIPISYGGEFQ